MPVRSFLPSFAAATMAVAAAQPAAASGRRAVVVTSAADAGPGSFRAAIQLANATPSITHVVFAGRDRTVRLAAPVDFSGGQDLTIEGAGATLDGAGIPGGPAFRATGGGSLAVLGLTVRNAPAEGVEVQVPPTATGTLRLLLAGVHVTGNRGHGVLVNDQVDSTTTDGVQPNAEGSAASLAVTVLQSRFSGNGYSVSDRDGLRVNEGGAGELTFVARFVAADGNAADGIELDERGTGDVRIDVLGATITGNGVFDPADLDDGFDIDEYDDGSITGSVAFATASDNFEEGLDFNENNAGDLRVDLAFVEASRNREEGIDYEEDDDFAGGGDLVVRMTGIRTNGNGADGGDAGLKIREKGAGALQVAVAGVEASNNLIGGIAIREDNLGALTATIERASTTGNAGHGIDFDENRATATDAVTDATASFNSGSGVRADQQTPGAGALTLTRTTLDGNAGAATTGAGVTVTVVPWTLTRRDECGPGDGCLRGRGLYAV